jgi:hypothetical protein
MPAEHADPSTDAGSSQPISVAAIDGEGPKAADGLVGKDPVAEATASLEHVFRTLNLTRVLYVDDVFEDPPGSTDWLASFIEARAIDEQALAALLPDVPIEVEDVWLDEARRWWDGADFEERARVMRGLESLIGGTKTVLDYTAPEELEELLPDFVDFVKIQPGEWPEKQEQLTASDPANRILCLFDINLGEGGGEGRVQSGIDLLASALQLEGVDEVFFGLFSTNFSIDNELNEWRDLAKEYPVLCENKGRFLPLAKARRDDVIQFAKGLEMMTLNVFCDRIKALGCKALDQAHHAAISRIRGLEVFDFEHIVLNGSYTEGAAEADTLFRLFHIFQQDDAKRCMLDGTSASAFNSNVVLARTIREHRVGGDQYPPHQRLEIRHQELYEGGELLNGFHSPLRSGDVFRTRDNRRWYILLAPPCNLAVRKNGKRRVSRVTLVPIKLRSETWVAEKRAESPAYFASRKVLRYLWWDTPEGAAEPAWMWGVVEFVGAGGIEADVLDLATMNTNGLCRIDVNAELAAPVQMHSAWERRVGDVLACWKRVHGKLEGLRRRIARLQPGDQKEIWSAMMPKPADPMISVQKDCLNGSVFDFGLERVLHYRMPYSSNLLSDYTQYISRNATPFDFARDDADQDEA